MDSKMTSIIAYITWIGLVVAFCAGDKESELSKTHLNNALILVIASIICGIIPFIGWLCEIAVLVFWIMGLISAIKGEAKELPLIGQIHIINK